MEDLKFKYLERLSEIYPTIAQASTEVINLQAILNLRRERNIFLQIFMGNMRRLPMFLRMALVPCAVKWMLFSEIL